MVGTTGVFLENPLHRHIGDILQEHKPDILALLETRMREHNAKLPMEKLSRRYQIYEVMHGNGHTGGIWVSFGTQEK